MSADALAELGTPLVVAGAVAGLVLGEASPARAYRPVGGSGGGRRVLRVRRPGRAVGIGHLRRLHGPRRHRRPLRAGGLDRLPRNRASARCEPSSYRETLEAYFDSGYPLGAPRRARRPCARSPSSTSPGRSSRFSPSSRPASRSRSYGAARARGRGRLAPGRARGARRAARARLRVRDAGQRQGDRDAAGCVPLVAALVSARARLAARGRAARPVPLAVVGAAAVAAIGVAVAVWLGPVLVVSRSWSCCSRRPRSGRTRRPCWRASCAGAVALLSMPTLLRPRRLPRRGRGGRHRAGGVRQPARAPLKLAQVFGDLARRRLPGRAAARRRARRAHADYVLVGRGRRGRARDRLAGRGGARSGPLLFLGGLARRSRLRDPRRARRGRTRRRWRSPRPAVLLAAALGPSPWSRAAPRSRASRWRALIARGRRSRRTRSSTTT